MITVTQMTRKEKDSWMRNNDSHKQKKKEVHYTVNSLTYLDIKKKNTCAIKKKTNKAEFFSSNSHLDY